MKKKHAPLAFMVNTMIIVITLAISLSLVAICDRAYREAVLAPYEDQIRDAEIQCSALVPYLEHFAPYLGTEELQAAKEGAGTGEDHLIAWMEQQPYSGTGRMLDALNENAACAPDELLTQVRKAVDAFVGNAEQFDDLTMLCLEYHGPENPASVPDGP